jgi:hypothetical protein
MGSAQHERIVVETRIFQRIGDDQHIVLQDGVAAK